MASNMQSWLYTSTINNLLGNKMAQVEHRRCSNTLQHLKFASIVFLNANTRRQALRHPAAMGCTYPWRAR